MNKIADVIGLEFEISQEELDFNLAKRTKILEGPPTHNPFEEFVNKSDMIHMITLAALNLPPKEGAVFMAYHNLGKYISISPNPNFKEVSEATGINRSSINELYSRAVRDIRNYIFHHYGGLGFLKLAMPTPYSNVVLIDHKKE